MPTRKKGKGFLGKQPSINKKGRRTVSTELSIGVKFDGKERTIPTLVPTLSTAERKIMLGGNTPTKAIVKKAVAHARKRIKAHKSPFK